MDHGTSEQPIQHRSSRKTAVLPELETFLHLLIVVRTIDNENIDKVICGNIRFGLTIYRLKYATLS
jgi:hypothetical protein